MPCSYDCGSLGKAMKELKLDLQYEDKEISDVARAHGSAGVMAGKVGNNPKYDPEQDARMTPPALVAGIAKLLGFDRFDLDPAASKLNAQADRYFDIEDDGLGLEWNGNVWLNPPFGPAGSWIKLWLAKARAELDVGHCRIVATILPAKVETQAFHEHVLWAPRTFVPDKRLIFFDSKGEPFRDSKGRITAAGFGVVVPVFERWQQPTQLIPITTDGKLTPRGMVCFPHGAGVSGGRSTVS